MDWVDGATGKRVSYTENAADAARYWVQAVVAGKNAGKMSSVQQKYFEVRYEDIVQNPEPTLRGLFTALDEPWNPCVLEFHTKNRDLAGESSASQVSQKL
jgi:hypothetical protein